MIFISVTIWTHDVLTFSSGQTNSIKGKGSKYSSTDGAYGPGVKSKAGKQSKGSKGSKGSKA